MIGQGRTALPDLTRRTVAERLTGGADCMTDQPGRRRASEPVDISMSQSAPDLQLTAQEPGAYSRVLLKLSGETFGGGGLGVDPDVVRGVAEQIAVAVRSGVQVSIVVGGGNFFRGAQLAERGMERTRADYMGM